MNIRDSSVNVIILGGWNLNIFTPKWIANKLLKEEKVQIEFAINKSAPTRFTGSGIRVIPMFDRLMIMPVNNEDATLEKIKEVVIELMTLLPHTPVSAFGINFGFIEPEPEPELLKYFNLDDNEGYLQDFEEIKQIEIKRSLIKDGLHVNISLAKVDSQVNIDFNYHFDTVKTELILEELEKHSLPTLKSEATSLLNTIYNLEFELGDDNE